MSEKGTYNNKRIAKNTLFLYIRMLFVLIVSLYTSRVILQVLGVTDFGVYNVVAGFITMFSFLNTSLVSAIQRFYNYEKSTNADEGITKVYNTALIIQICLACLVLLLLETFGLWYLNNVMVIPADRMFAARILYHASVLSTIVVILQIPYSAAIVSFERMDFYALVGIIDIVLKLLIVLLLPFIPNDKLITYGVLLLLVSIIDFLLYFFYAKKKFGSLVVRKTNEKGLFKSMLAFSGWNFVGTFAALSYTQGLNLVLNFFFGPVVNAARGLAAMVMSAIHGFSLNITVAFRPQLIESYANKDYYKTKEIMYSESKICYLMLFLLVVPVILEIDYILHLWLGPEVPENTAVFTILILIQMLISSFNPAFTQITHAVGKLRNFQLVTSAIAFSVIPISYLVLKAGGEPYTVFVVSIILTVITVGVCMLLVKQIFDYSIKDFLKKVIIPAFAITIASPIFPFVVHTSLSQSFFRLVLVTVVSVICTSTLSYLLLLDSRERSFVKEKYKQLLQRIH